jgi:hypothetical protein
MREILIKIKIDELTDRIATLIRHRGFPEYVNEAGVKEESIDQILEMVGILENLKQEFLIKLKTKSGHGDERNKK